MAAIAGVLVAGAGLVGLQVRPDEVVTVSADLDTPVLVIPPDVLSIDGTLGVTVEATALVRTVTARPVDAYAWIRGESTTVVRGLESWEELQLLKPALYSPDDSEFAGDIWRTSRTGWGDTRISPLDALDGSAVVVLSQDGTSLRDVSFEIGREVGFTWAWPAISIGAMLAALSLVLFAIPWLDPRPRRADAEREGAGRELARRGLDVPDDNAPALGTRRARREAANTDEPATSAKRVRPAKSAKGGS